MDIPTATALLSDCNLCPRRCGVDRTAGQRGYCGAGDKLRAARAALHFWEEPCISGTRGSGTVFFSGCSLGCIYCQNGKISRGGEGIDITPQRLAEIFLELQAQGAHNINLVTPMHFAPLVINALERVRGRELRIPVLVNTGGYECVDTVRMFAGLVDIWLPDFKYADSALAGRYSNAPDYPQTALAAIDGMLQQAGTPRFDGDGIMQSGVIVRHLLLPGALGASMQAVKTLWDRYGDDVYMSLMSQYTPMGTCERFPQLSRRVSPRHYEALCDFAASLGITRCYVQEGESADAAFIPAFDGEGIVEKSANS